MESIINSDGSSIWWEMVVLPDSINNCVVHRAGALKWKEESSGRIKDRGKILRGSEKRFTWMKAPQIDDDTKFICSKMSCEIYSAGALSLFGMNFRIKRGRNENKWFIPEIRPKSFISRRIINKKSEAPFSFYLHVDYGHNDSSCHVYTMSFITFMSVVRFHLSRA